MEQQHGYESNLSSPHKLFAPKTQKKIENGGTATTPVQHEIWFSWPFLKYMA
jgi:hypothetical protein